VTVVSAPPGSGKTVLLRSWTGQAALTGRVAWVAVGRDERDPQRFWLSVLGALRQTAPGSALVRPLTAAPDLDGWVIAERLMKDLAPLEERIWLVIDDVHGLDSDEALRQLELLVMRGPPELRFVLATRHDVRLGLHRLRLEGELTELRAPDLRFTLEEARELLRGAGVELAEPTLALLHERTEGWAAGLRLAALSLARHPHPERFAEQFSGSERTVAEYLLAEVLERQSEEVRRLLLRTSVLERVNGELADLLTEDNSGERVLQDLEEANAFVVALDAGRSWFRYHHLFADLLQLELRRTAPDEVAAAAADRSGGPGRGAARPGPGAACAGDNQSRHRRVRGGQVRGGRAAPGPRRDAGAPDRASLSGVHRPGLPGGDRDVAVVYPAGRLRQASDRAGRTARLDRRADHRHRLPGTRRRNGRAVAAGRGRGLNPAR
jgi:LuxR family maltose regulon positive regulatory protein